MTKNKELVPFAIIKLKKLGFRALGQPIDLNCSDQPHLGPPAMYLTGPGLQSVNGVTVSSLVSCFSWLLCSWSLHLIDYFALSGTVHRPCYQDFVQMLWIVPWWVRAPPVLSSPSAPSSSYLVEQPCSCCSLLLRSISQRAALWYRWSAASSTGNACSSRQKTELGSTGTLWIWVHIFPQRRSFSVLLLDLPAAYLNISHERLFQQGIHHDVGHSQDRLSGLSRSPCSWMCHSRQIHFLCWRTVHLVSVGQLHSPAAGRGHWQLVDPTGSHTGFPTCLREEALLSLNMWYCHLPACTHHSL